MPSSRDPTSSGGVAQADLPVADRRSLDVLGGRLVELARRRGVLAGRGGLAPRPLRPRAGRRRGRRSRPVPAPRWPRSWTRPPPWRREPRASCAWTRRAGAPRPCGPAWTSACSRVGDGRRRRQSTADRGPSMTAPPAAAMTSAPDCSSSSLFDRRISTRNSRIPPPVAISQARSGFGLVTKPRSGSLKAAPPPPPPSSPDPVTGRRRRPWSRSGSAGPRRRRSRWPSASAWPRRTRSRRRRRRRRDLDAAPWSASAWRSASAWAWGSSAGPAAGSRAASVCGVGFGGRLRRGLRRRLRRGLGGRRRGRHRGRRRRRADGERAAETSQVCAGAGCVPGVTRT